MNGKFWKRLLAVLLSAALLTAGIPTAAFAAGEEEAEGWTWQQADNDSVTAKLPRKTVSRAEEQPEHKDSDMVRVSILLDGTPTLERFSGKAADIASRSAAKTYRSQLEKRQDAVISSISGTVLKGGKLDVVWKLSFVANLISANVRYGQIEEIKAVRGVRDVVVENQYFPNTASSGDSAAPNMEISSDMTGATQAWASNYKGAGMRVAIVDTGLDIDHQSFNAEAFDKAVQEDAAAAGKNVTDYQLLSEAEISGKLSQLNAYKSGRNVTAGDLYRSTKIPFAYCYVDKDLDVTHQNDTQGEHGSHVAGIATANRYLKKDDGSFVDAMNEVHMTGEAPDAQVLVMKVFGNGGGANDSDYMAAIEDAVILGCDAVNLSLGSANPGASKEAGYAYQGILDSLTSHDTVVSISAGNAAAWADESYPGGLYSDDVSFDMTGSPGSYENSLCVASVDNNGMVGIYFAVGSLKVVYTEAGSTALATLDTNGGAGKEYDYIFASGNGSEVSHFAGANGKVAFVQRGECNFSVKAQNAFNAGAIACVVYNNAPGTINMDLTGYTGTAPVVSITLDEGEKIEDMGTTGKIKIFSTVQSAPGSQTSPGYTMSDFSSWGVPGSLTMKPEITAPGGNIWSVNGEHKTETGTTAGGQDKYELMSGTSMAAPQVAGIIALVKQYIEEKKLSQTGMTDRALIQSLLMSTATPLKDGDGSYWSVLKQGAGLANAAAATTADSYITMDSSATDSYGDGKVKVELGEISSSSIPVKFSIHNMDGKAHQYDLSAAMFTQAGDTDDYGSYMDQGTQTIPSEAKWTVEPADADSAAAGLDFNNDGKVNTDDGQALLDYVVKGTVLKAHADEADVDGDGDVDTHDVTDFLNKLTVTGPVTVPAGGSVDITGAITLDSSAIADLQESFPNGFYIEGFVSAKAVASSEGEKGTSHSIPVLGWYGSWTDPTMFDKGSLAEYSHMEGGESRAPYIYSFDAEGNPVPNIESNYLSITYGDGSGSYYYAGNPLVGGDDEYACGVDAAYLPERNALNSQNGDALEDWYFTPIRNAAASRLTITDTKTGAVYYSQELGSVDGAFYYSGSSGEGWESTGYTAPLTWAGTDAGGKPLKEGTTVELALTLVPEYYVDGNTVRWEDLGEGASLTTPVTIDNTPPELTSVDAQPDDNKQLTLTAEDNQYVAAFALYDSTGENLLSYGSPDQTVKNAEASVTLDLSDYIGQKFKLQVFDYASNISTYDVTYQGLDPEITEPDYLAFDNSWINWFGLKNNGNAGLYANSTYSVAAAEAVNGYVFTVNAPKAGSSLSLYATALADMPVDVNSKQIVAPLDSAVAKVLDMAYSKTDHTLYLLANVADSQFAMLGLIGIDPLTGELSSISSSFNVELCTLAVDESGTFYGFDGDGKLYSFTSDDVFSGGAAVLTEIGTVAGLPAGAPVSADWADGKVIAAASDGSVYAISPDGSSAQSLGGPLGSGDLSALCALNETDNGLNLETPAAQAHAVILSESETQVIRGRSIQLSAIATPWTLADRGVTWRSSDPSVAAVDANGKVTGVKNGTATITATSKATPAVSASCEVEVLSVDADLNALLWDEDGAIWWSKFNTGTLPSYTKNKQSTVTQLASATMTAGDGIIAATFDESAGSVLYQVDPQTLEEIPLNDGSGAPVVDLAYSPTFDLLMGVYGPYLVLYDVSSEYMGVVQWLSSGNLTAIAYGGTMEDEDAGPVDMFYLLDTAGNLYVEGLYFNEQFDSLSFAFHEDYGYMGDTGCKSKNCYNSAVCTTAANGNEYLFWSQYDGGDYVNMVAISTDTGTIYELGNFPATVWPVGGLISESIPGNRAVSSRVAEKLMNAQLSGQPQALLQKIDLAPISEAAPAAKTEKRPQAAQSARAIQIDAESEGVKVDPTAKTVTVPVMVDQSSNGQLTLAYNSSDLTFKSASYGDAALHSDAVSTGSIKLGYAAVSAFSGKEADLVFTYTAAKDDRDTTLTLTVLEDGGTGEAEPVEITVSLPGAGETTPVTPPVVGPGSSEEPSETEPVVEVSTADDGTVTTTTTWPDGKKAVEIQSPDGKTTIEVTSPAGEKLADISLPAAPGESKKFTDVPEDSWYTDEVYAATGYGLFSGMTETTFEPATPMTRAMLVTVLHNLSGEPGYGAGSASFTDVRSGSWYEDPVDWAVAVGVAAGMGGGKFAPSQNITREQLVSMLYRYANLIGAGSKNKASLSAFPDSGKVAKYASDAMEWAVAEGLVSGRAQGGVNYLAPKGTATRAEVAAILTKFVEYLKK